MNKIKDDKNLHYMIIIYFTFLILVILFFPRYSLNEKEIEKIKQFKLELYQDCPTAPNAVEPSKNLTGCIPVYTHFQVCIIDFAQ